MRNNKNPKNKNDGKLGISNLMKLIYDMPLPLVLRNIEQNIELLSQRGIRIRDWDNKDRVLTQVRIIGGKVYFLAATEPEAKKGLEKRKQHGREEKGRRRKSIAEDMDQKLPRAILLGEK
jgi:hypothetical protein